MCVHGEGEETVVEILDCLKKINQKEKRLNFGISYINRK